MSETAFIPSFYKLEKDEGSVLWNAPSNIALVKYWGKKQPQLPANPSLSFTLNSCSTTTRLSYRKKERQDQHFSYDFLFDGVANQSFRPKIDVFFKRIAQYLPFLHAYHFTIDTGNSFPHSSGIASSASGMAALALCFADLERQNLPGIKPAFFNKKASFLARLGSGSAGRSISGPMMEWGYHDKIPESSDLYAIDYPFAIHSVFKSFRDTILLVDKGRKQVSSSLGHDLMHGHPYAKARFAQANAHISELKAVLEAGDLEAFMRIVEMEALGLHAMMLTSNPYFILMKAGTLKIIESVRIKREDSGLPVCFTLDAGANVHLLYPGEYQRQVQDFIKEELMAYCENGQYICDQIGNGAKKM
jgi:diphosphomevalonate decarboxylase